MELLSKSDKMHLTAGQTSALATFYNQCMNSLAASIEVAFTPTQEWIDKFAAINYFFYQTYATDGNNDRPVAVTYLIKPGKTTEPWELRTEESMPVDGSPWVPQNGELVEAFWGGWFRSIYIGRDEDMDCYVVRDEQTGKYTNPKEIRKWLKTQVPLAELLSVYASVKGLTQDGVELKPEN